MTRASPITVSEGAIFVETGVPCSSYTVWRNLSDGRREPDYDAWHVGPFHYGPDDEEPDGTGKMEIRVQEIVKTSKSGTLAVYYRVYLDPEDGEICRRRKVTSLSALRGLISGHRMTAKAVEASK